MLTIRLARQGRKNLVHFRLVVQEKTVSPKSGKYAAIIGHYNPSEPDNKLTFDQAKLDIYLKNGATPSDTVARLLTKAGVKGLEKFIAKYTHKVNEAKTKAEEAKADTPAEAKKSEEKPTEEKSKADTPATEEKSEEKPAEEKSKADTPATEEKSEEKPTEEK